MKWQGHVVQLTQRKVYGRVTRVDKDEVDDISFPRTHVRKEDRDLLAEGATFDLEVTGKKVVLKFNRYPPWTQKEIDAARKRAEEQAKFFAVE